MTVKELIRELRRFPKDAIVEVLTYPYPDDDCTTFCPVRELDCRTVGDIKLLRLFGEGEY